MKKSILAISLSLLFFLPPLFADEGSSAVEKESGDIFVFLSNQVPRYEGLAAGGFLFNQYALGGWSDFAAANFGGGFDAEYTIPAFLPYNLDLGASIHFEAGHTFPKADTTLKSHSDLRLYVAAFLRIPFTFMGQNFAFQPEIGYGASFNHCIGQNHSKAYGWYTDQIITFAPALRYIAPVDFLSNLEFELSPYWTFSPEQANEAVNFLGFRIGVVWHLQDFFKSRKSRKAEEDKYIEEKQEEETQPVEENEPVADDSQIEQETEKETDGQSDEGDENRSEEELAQKLREELARMLKYPELFLGVDPDELTDFTPDGDGVHDTITFHPATSYMSEPPEEWTLTIIDPQGNGFRTWSGTGYPPQEIVWDGLGDDGTLAFSRENYKAQLSVTLCEKDRQLLGRDELEAIVEGYVTIANGIILKRTGEGEWRIELTSISFDPDKATFNNLSEVELVLFMQSLDEIAQKMLTVKDTKVRVEGYANSTTGTEKENIEDLIPLSQKRAEKIEELLIERGIESEKITAVGMGGANPKASLTDRANWWKNRRIEIVLTKEAADENE
ncbi:MAG: OmpA family protein [Treponema sp.]|nr:OmpA family protein [Treponema sp.]